MHPASEFSDFRLVARDYLCSRSPGCHCGNDANFLSLVTGATQKNCPSALRLLLPQHLELVFGQLSGSVESRYHRCDRLWHLSHCGHHRYVQAQSKASLIHVALNSTHRLDYRSKSAQRSLPPCCVLAGIVAPANLHGSRLHGVKVRRLQSSAIQRLKPSHSNGFKIKSQWAKLYSGVR